MSRQWLNDTVFYEIYPQSFYDTNGDGIGDLNGIIEKLDYIKGLGCGALWINPCFDSPFKDAGYDVRDYKKIAPRYGTNEDMYTLFEQAHKRGIKVLLDLVPGHTSEEHEWFKASGRAERNEYSDRYIWTNSWIEGIPDHPYIGGECERNATYMLNFFKCQPALNYGWGRLTREWQKPVNDPACLANRESMKDIIMFWLEKGADGFRVDMADSLVKDDDGNKSNTAAVWRDIFSTVRSAYPDAAFVSEWSNPSQAICGAGFDMDFYLDHGGNGYNTLMRDYETPGGDRSYFKAGAGGDIGRFLKDYLPKYDISRRDGFISFFTCNHDTPRPSNNLDTQELKIAYAFLLTMPGVPFLYYGDEIGMRYIADTPTKEGGYTRTGSRTPMQWNGEKNHGFSSADNVYIPTDTIPSAPTVEQQEKDESSLLNTVRRIIAFRHSRSDLRAAADFEPLLAGNGSPFVYRRGALRLAVSPSKESYTINIGSGKLIFSIGEVTLENESLTMSGCSFAVIE